MNAFCPNYEDLISRYIDVCNQSIAVHRVRFPYQQIFNAIEARGLNKFMEWIVLDQHSTSSYFVNLIDKKICLCDQLHCFHFSAPAKRWKVSKHYLESVTANPEVYISNPTKINWDWCFSVSND